MFIAYESVTYSDTTQLSSTELNCRGVEGRGGVHGARAPNNLLMGGQFTMGPPNNLIKSLGSAYYTGL